MTTAQDQQSRAEFDAWWNEFAPFEFDSIGGYEKTCAYAAWKVQADRAAAQVLAMGRVPADAIDVLKEYEAFFEQLFAQACSNGLFDAWARPINCTRLNTAHHMADRALKAHSTGD